MAIAGIKYIGTAPDQGQSENSLLMHGGSGSTGACYENNTDYPGSRNRDDDLPEIRADCASVIHWTMIR